MNDNEVEWNPRSAKQLCREEQCQAMFHQAKAEYEQSAIQESKRVIIQPQPVQCEGGPCQCAAAPADEATTGFPGADHRVERAIPPRMHLSTWTWNVFNAWVRLHPGWEAERTLCTEEELAQLDDSQRKPYDGG